MSNNSLGDDENFCCPVTSELFTDPAIIPECGHTFDRPALIKLPNKKCPICNTEFHDLPQDLPTNWLAVSHLNLSIKPKKKSKKIKKDKKTDNSKSVDMNYDADQANKDYKKYIKQRTRNIIKDIIIQIKKKAASGGSSIEINISHYYVAHDPKQELENKIKSILEAKKYDVTIRTYNYSPFFTISWK